MKILPRQLTCTTQKCIVLTITWAVLLGMLPLFAQPITGVWRGQIIRGSGFRQSTAPVEIKLVATGDSIRGTAYYYKSSKSYIRYSLKGYFNITDGSVVWQDYYMIEIAPNKTRDAKAYDGSMKYMADYSCPDGKTLRLDGTCQLPNDPEMKLELKKVNDPMFPDEWDEVIEGYYAGMNRKEVVDSVWYLVSEPMASLENTSLMAGTTSPKPVNSQKGEAGINAVDVVKGPPLIPVPVPLEEVNNDTLVITGSATFSAPGKPIVTAPKPVSTSQGAAPMVSVDMVKGPPLIPVPPTDEIRNTDTVIIAKTTIAEPEKPVAVPVKPTPRPSAPVDLTAEIAKANATKTIAANPAPATSQPPAPKTEVLLNPVPKPPSATSAAIVNTQNPITASVMAQAFTTRKKVIQTEIPVSGDTLELRFYDNAEVDGDSISLFLNGVVLFQHVRLEVRPYIFKIPLDGLPDISELTMVAENLGAIPPNTAYMEAIVKGQRYTARLESTESSSGVVRLVRNE